ncbi:hypothetical protein N0V95_001876 [Ascochyta clinopodiicola]|nr:hypothetical protein N0V95_001876 [Ascochyta clinopodiicola]
MLGNRLVIGLDYGTTHTGVAFCETSDNSVLEKHIEVIMNWPGPSRAATKEKVPSEIAYTREGTEWGLSIPAGEPRHMWTKLDLDRTNHRTQVGEAARILNEMTLNGSCPAKQPVDIVADFLRKVKDHLIVNLDDQFGPKLWRTLPITLVVTVPAVWSDAAKSRTMEAVSKGGFNAVEFPQVKRVVTTTEPEAAAIYTMKSFDGSVQKDRFAIGDGFVVCDMGGGTVDLISYRVADLEPTALEEATIGNGDQCGSSFVDQAFVRFLERRLGPDDFQKLAGCRSEDVSRTSLPPKLSQMVRRFALDVKGLFTGNEVHFFLGLPYLLRNCENKKGISDGELIITPDDMRQMFDSALRRTYELLLDQIQQAQCNGVRLKYVFMVGGFSESSYVFSEIKTFVESYGLEVIRPAFPWSAVVRGAAAKGIEGDGRPRIRNRKCRRSYGTNCVTPFVAGKHRVVDKFKCEFKGIFYAHHQMKWLVNKGQDLSTTSECHHKLGFVQWFWPSKKRIVYMDLLATDADKAPHRSKHEAVYKVATLEANLETVPEWLFLVRHNPSGALYYEIEFDVEIAVQSALEFSMSINGKKYGSVTAKYT